MSTQLSAPDWWRHLLQTRGGVFNSGEAKRAGMYRRTLTRVAAQEWTDLGHGLFMAGTDPQHRQLLWAAVLHAGPGACLGGVSALLEQSFPSWDHDVIEVVAPRHVRPREGCRFHRATRHVVDLGGLPAAGAAEAAVDAAVWAVTDKQAATIVRIVLQQGLATPDAVEACIRKNTRRAVLLREVVCDARGGLTTSTEAAFARTWSAAGLPPLRRQESFIDSLGVRRRVDLTAHPIEFWGLTHRLGMELLGLHHHEVVQAADDSRRAADALAQGLVLLSIPNHEVLEDLDAYVQKWAGILRGWGWTG